MDIRIEEHGSIVILYGESADGLAWLEASLDPEGQRWGKDGFVVEPRYVSAIIDNAVVEGQEVGT